MSHEAIGQKTIAALRSILERIKSGEPVEAAKIARHDTPDGPMHTRENVFVTFSVDSAEDNR